MSHVHGAYLPALQDIPRPEQVVWQPPQAEACPHIEEEEQCHVQEQTRSPEEDDNPQGKGSGAVESLCRECARAGNNLATVCMQGMTSAMLPQT